MYVERVLSLNDGWSVLAAKPHEWAEVQKALLAIEDDYLIRGIRSANGMADQAFFIPYCLYLLCNLQLAELAKTNENVVKLPVRARTKEYNSHDLGKFSFNGVYASMIGVDDLSVEDLVNSLYITIPKYHEEHSVEVSIIFVPSAAAAQHFAGLGATSEQIAFIPTEEFCRTQAPKFIATSNQIPVVFAFFSPSAPDEITVEELSVLKVGGHTIERTIEFAPEYYQAGVGLLSYFGEVLRQKDPNTTAKVRIEQDGTTVRLHIESASGEIETIEKELEKFALVISNQIQPEDMFENRAYVMQLENKLAITKMEVKHAQDTHQLTVGLTNQRINTLEQQVTALTNQLSSALLQNGQVFQLATQQVNSHERIVMALIDHSQGLFKDMLQEASGNQALGEAVRSLQNSLLAGIDAVDAEDKLERALATIKEEKPGFLGRILTEFRGAAYKAGASSAITWVTKWIQTHKA